MTINRPPNDIAVDRREETVVTQQPGYAATEQVVRDVAAERRQTVDMINRIVWSIAGLLEIFLGMRFVFKLISANPDSGFAKLVYGITGPFVAPFVGLIGTPTSGGAVLEATTLIAMAIYALFFWGVVHVIQLIADRPRARTVTRAVREQTPDGGVDRTTYTTRSD